MSQIIVIALAIVSIAVTTCRALPDIHKQMSPQQLQSIFHVDSHDAVPQYEVVQLLHQHSEEPASASTYSNYRRRKRSIDELTPNSAADDDLHHVKKDLSKTPYFSEGKSSPKKANSLTDNQKRKHVKNIHEHKVQLAAFGQKLNLTLKKTQGLYKKGELHKLPMWFMNEDANATHGVNLEKIEDEHSHSSDNIGEVYQDEENMAAILMRRHEITGDLVMEGSIGHDMVIKPLPHELNPQPEASHHHVVYKRSVDQMEHLSDFAYMEPDDMATHEKLEKLQERQKRSAHFNTLADIEEEQEELEAEDGVNIDEHSTHKRAKRHAPYMIYPEVLVIVDYDGYRLHGGDNLQVKRYFIAFWNGVDLRYRLLKEPKIRVSIAGIIISRGRDATPYLERNRVGRDAIDSAAALTDMGKYLFRERRLPVYDIAVAITKYDMCRRRKGGRCTKGTAGFAYVGGACVVNRRLEKVNSVAIIEDTGGFSGIIVAAHEVGHLLGAVHDGSPPPSYLGGPGAQRCRWEDGFIMSDLRHTERGFRWSACSVQSFQHFLNGATATCLYNVPHEDNALGRSLPGTLLSLDAQCRRDRGTYACFKDERVCAQLFCFDAQTGYCVAYRPAAEGSTCGNNMHCLDGRCTSLPVASNLITNYGGQRGYNNNSVNGAATNSKQGNNNENDEDDDDDDDDDDNDDDDDEDSDSGRDNDESNETIEKQKRKLNIPISTTMQQQQQLQASPPTPSTYYKGPTSATGIDTPPSQSHAAAAPHFGIRSVVSNPSLLETYIKKLQALTDNNNDDDVDVDEITEATLTRTTTHDVQTKTLDKTERSIYTTAAGGGDFLKRTPSSSSSSSSISSNNNNHNKNPYTKTSKATTTSSRGNGYKFISQQHQSLKIIPETERQTSSSPASAGYVTNYIGDNTNRLASIVQQHHHHHPQQQNQQQTQSFYQQQQQKTYSKLMHQQQQKSAAATSSSTGSNNKKSPSQQQHPQYSSTTTTNPTTSTSLTATTRRPKIKTQKLIRRLRTQKK